MHHRKWWRGRRSLKLFVGAAVLAAIAAPVAIGGAGGGSDLPVLPQGASYMQPSQTLHSGAAVSRNPSGHFVPAGAKVPAFRPTMPLDKYEAQKAAEAQGSNVKPSVGSSGPSTSPAIAPALAPCPGLVAGTCNFTGTPTEANCGCSPPDPNSAASGSQIVEITNSELDVYSLSTHPPSNVRSVSLNSFFGYGNNLIFDPRVMWDANWNRWVISAEGSPESSANNSPQYFFLGFSTTSNAAGPFYIYQVNVNFFADAGHFEDYPQIGMNQDAVIVTWNHFNNTTEYADTFALAKSRVYNGQGFSVPVFTGLIPTTTPTLETASDQHPYSWLLSAANNDNKITEYKFFNPQAAFDSSLATYGTVPVPAYALPPKAPQNNGNIIDTGDNRFVNDPAADGNIIWAVHTVQLGSFPAPYYYEINAATRSIVLSREGYFFQSSTSYDWNASVAATTSTTPQIYFTWTSSDKANNKGPGESIGHRASNSDGATVAVGPQTIVGSEDTDFTCTGGSGRGCRWGDTSSVVIDPLNSADAWITNQFQSPGTTWKTQIARLKP